jgi:transposase
MYAREGATMTVTVSPGRVDARYAGIDVSKDHLEVAVCGGDGAPAGTPRRLPNTAAGLRLLREALERAAPRLVAVAATGAYHLPLVRALAAAQIPVAVVNPARVKAFRQRRLERHTTDRQDARRLARFASRHAPELVPYTPPPPEQEALRQRLAYRDAVSTWRPVLLNQREANPWAGAHGAAGWVAQDLAQVEARRRAIDGESERVLARLPEAGVLRTLKGAGPLVVAAVLAYLPVAVWGRPEAAAACAGVHPAIFASGRTERRRRSKTGCSRLRRSLDCGARSARQWDPELRAFSERLRARGKPKKVALVAVMHKLLRRLMGRLREFRDGPRPGERARAQGPTASTALAPALAA